MQISSPDQFNQAANLAQEQSQVRKRERLIYIRYILMSTVLFGLAASIQFDVVMNQLRPQFILMPIFMALGFGVLLGRISILKERLAQRTRQFRAVADFAQEFTYFRSLDGDYEYVSPSCESLTGYPQEQFYANPNFMDNLIHPQDQDLWQQHLQQVNATGEVESIDLRIIHKDGHEVWINHVCGPVFDGSNNIIGVRSTNIKFCAQKYLYWLTVHQ